MTQFSQDWREVPLGDFVTFQRGYDITKAQQLEGPYPVISSSGIKSYHAEYKFDGPGVIIGRKGSLGTVFFSANRYWPHDTTLWVKDFHGNHPSFCYYFLQGMGFQQYDVGAANPTLNRNHIHSLPVVVPPLPTQQRIAAILSTYDDLIENNTRRIAILEEMARRLYEEWFFHFRFPGQETAEFDGDLPRGWRKAKLGELVDERRDAVQPDAIDPDTPYVGLEHIPRRSLTLREWSSASEVQSTKLRFIENDILFGKIRPYFHKVVFAPLSGVASSDTIILRAFSQEHFPLALCCASSDAFVDHATQTSNGTKMPRANWQVLSQYIVAVPDAPLLERFNGVMLPLLQKLKLMNSKNTNLRAQRDLLLPRLISGEIDVSGAEAALEAAE